MEKRRSRSRKDQEADAKFAAKKQKTLLKRVTIVGASTVAALAVSAYCMTHREDSHEPETAATTPIGRDLFADSQPLPQLTEVALKDAAQLAAIEYTRFTDVFIDPAEYSAITYLAPNYDKMTPEQREKFCGNGLELKCREALAITRTGKKEVYYYQDASDSEFRGFKNTELARAQQSEDVFHSLSHEASHWVSKQQPISEEMTSLIKKYFGPKNPNIDFDSFENFYSEGATLVGNKKGGKGIVNVFNALEEAEAEQTSRFILTHRGVKVYLNFNNPNDTYVIGQRKLLDDLLSKISPNLGDTIRLVAQSRVKPGGREELFKMTGKKFGADNETALEKGFQIFFAIDGADLEGYRALTQK